MDKAYKTVVYQSLTTNSIKHLSSKAKKVILNLLQQTNACTQLEKKLFWKFACNTIIEFQMDCFFLQKVKHLHLTKKKEKKKLIKRATHVLSVFKFYSIFNLNGRREEKTDSDLWIYQMEIKRGVNVTSFILLCEQRLGK